MIAHDAQPEPELSQGSAGTGLPLAGVRVLDLTQGLAGAFCTLVLADFGADVVKIERPDGGDPARHLGARRSDGAGRSASSEFVYLGRNKRSMTLDLRTPAGAAIFGELVQHADVLVENSRPDFLDRLGLGYRTLHERNERLIYACISGFGHRDILESPFWSRGGYNPQIQAMSGIAEMTGQADGPPVDVGVPLADFVPALFATIGILMALEARRSTGRGQMVDTAMYDALAVLNARAIMRYTFAGDVISRGRGVYSAVITSIVRCADGYVSVSVLGAPAWERFCSLIGHPELLQDPQLQTEAARAANNAERIRPLLEEWALGKTKAELTAVLTEAGIGAGAVQNAADLAACPHLQARQMLVEIDDMLGGKVLAPGNPVKLSACAETPRRQAPALGEHTEQILASFLGLSDQEIAGLRQKRVV
ncbi:MAG: CoA transferase [Chloroflexi bacterium]|nr:CoA transferase [Chloroflexota bacterium]